MKKSLTKKERLGKADLKTVFQGRRKGVKGPFSKLVYLENGLNFSRFAISVGKKNGKACRRNYIKRIGREIYRGSKEAVKTGYDLIWIVYPNKSDFCHYQEEFSVVMKKALLYKK
jgi:ribonuclease P protein component